jgi:hypothetical protein
LFFCNQLGTSFWNQLGEVSLLGGVGEPDFIFGRACLAGVTGEAFLSGVTGEAFLIVVSALLLRLLVFDCLRGRGAAVETAVAPTEFARDERPPLFF